MDLKDSSGIEVDADIFDELMTSSEVSFKVFTGEQSGKTLSYRLSKVYPVAHSA